MRTEETTLKDLMNPGAAEDFFARRPMDPFDPAADPARFSLPNALWLMELSRLVYRRNPDQELKPHSSPRSNFLGPKNLEEIKFFNDDKADTQAMLVQPTTAPKWAALVFRGTEQKVADVISDLGLSVPLLRKEAIVHRGFKRALDVVWDEIKSSLDQLGDVPLFMTGHSLGAALATLAAARHTPRAVYTFGSPLVGNHAFVETLNGVPIHRVVDDIDGVTFVPPPLLGYEHVGKVRHLSEDPEPSLLLHAEKVAFDHAPVNYVDRLE
jgi:hypothetical protein